MGMLQASWEATALVTKSAPPATSCRRLQQPATALVPS